MCVKCAVDDAANAGDWDEVIRLAQAEKKAEKAELREDVEVKDDLKVEKTDSKASSKK